MKILVCISQVPDTTSKITFTDNSTKLNTAGLQYIINPYDEIALSKALELTADGKGTVTVINVGEANTEATLRKALATGADEAVRVNATPRDAWFVAHQLAAYVQETPFDLILTGRESIDYNGSKVAAFLGELLGIPSVNAAKKISVESGAAQAAREIEGGEEVLSIPLPVVAGTAEGVAAPRIPNMRGIMSARTKPLTVIAAVEVPVLTQVVRYELPTPKAAVKLVDATETATLVDLLHRAKII